MGSSYKFYVYSVRSVVDRWGSKQQALRMFNYASNVYAISVRDISRVLTVHRWLYSPYSFVKDLLGPSYDRLLTQ